MTTRRYVRELLEAIAMGPPVDTQVLRDTSRPLVAARIRAEGHPTRLVEVLIGEPWPLVSLCQPGDCTPSCPARRPGELLALVVCGIEWLYTGDWGLLVGPPGTAPTTAQGPPGRTDGCVGRRPVDGSGDAPGGAVGPVEGL